MRKLSEQWKINGKPIFTPALNTQYTWESLSGPNAGRTDDGIMHPEFIREQLTKIGLKYGAMTSEELDYLKSLIQGKEYTLTYFSPETQGFAELNCYTSGGSATLYTATRHNGLWTNVTFNCIEE